MSGLPEKGGGECAKTKQKIQTGMGFLPRSSQSDEVQRSLQEVCQRMQAELQSNHHRLPVREETKERKEVMHIGNEKQLNTNTS